MGTLIYDTFTAPDGTHVVAHTPDTGPGWEIFTGNAVYADALVIVSNSAAKKASTTSANSVLAKAKASGSQDQTLSMTVQVMVDRRWPIAYMLVDDPDTTTGYYDVYFNATGRRFYLRRYDWNGTSYDVTTIASGPYLSTETSVGTHTFEWTRTASGRHIIKYDGTVQIDIEEATYTHDGAIGIGLTYTTADQAAVNDITWTGTPAAGGGAFSSRSRLVNAGGLGPAIRSHIAMAGG
ncbi:hypothetical protein [Deferrisoma camini]|uniref:hypothetical protein n=1 Tax=Deferrisoma camini TaxID=1035120 RepID=UPI00146F3746|nr:hypothetical protein [Deferrisoma camini]